MTEIVRVGRGRPRDPDLQDRVFDAAMEIYAHGGWSAFTFEAIARRARIGKASLYLRWKTREDLLRETLEARWNPVQGTDTGTLEGDLAHLAHTAAQLMTGPYSSAFIRMRVDAYHFPEVMACLRPYTQATIRDAKRIVQRAIARGEIDRDVDASLVMDMLVGGITNHVLHAPPNRWPALVRRIDPFITALIGAVLRGVGYSQP